MTGREEKKDKCNSQKKVNKGPILFHSRKPKYTLKPKIKVGGKITRGLKCTDVVRLIA